jgi:SAM-dependent methyltransferase
LKAPCFRWSVGLALRTSVISKHLEDTTDPEYTTYLVTQRFGVMRNIAQAPYRVHIARACGGRVLDVGCGVGRHLLTLGSRAIGIDHNASSVEQCRRLGLTAYLPWGFKRCSEYRAPSFDTMLLSHVVEHMTFNEAVSLLNDYRRHLRTNGNLVLIAPQESGFASDPTHIEFFDFAKMRLLSEHSGFTVDRQYSFPFPRSLGRIFRHNEFVTIATKAEKVLSGSAE